jgi:N-acyl homoserine lactone hydrolase
MSSLASITITPVRVADMLAEGERMPVYVHVIDHPDARVLVDTGMTELHPAVADMDPRLRPLSEQDFDLAGIDIVVNTHLHFDHCGGNHLFAGRPIYVQRRELEDARSEDDYTIREWVDAPGVRYVPVDGELELLPGLRLVPAPGHTRGTQVVVVETGGRPVVVAGDVAVWFGELDEPHTEGQLLVRALDPSWSGSRTRTSRGDRHRPAEGPRAGIGLARPTGVGRAAATYTIPIEGRDEWLAAAGLGIHHDRQSWIRGQGETLVPEREVADKRVVEALRTAPVQVDVVACPEGPEHLASRREQSNEIGQPRS